VAEEIDLMQKYITERGDRGQPEREAVNNIPVVTKNECPYCGGLDCISENTCQMPGCGMAVIFNTKEFNPHDMTPEEATRIARIKSVKQQEYGLKKGKKAPSENDLWAEIARLKEQLHDIKQPENTKKIPAYLEKLIGPKPPPEPLPVPKKNANVKIEGDYDPFADF